MEDRGSSPLTRLLPFTTSSRQKLSISKFALEMKMTEPRYHPLPFVAFLLALFILVMPTQADIVFSLLRLGRTFEALLVIIVSIAIVVLPLLVAQRSTKRNPEKWKPRLLTKVTWVIIVLNLVLNVLILAAQMTRSESEQSPGAYSSQAADGTTGNAQEGSGGSHLTRTRETASGRSFVSWLNFWYKGPRGSSLIASFSRGGS